MNILFDQGTPVPLRTYLHDYEVETAYERGWSTLKNGELLKEAEANGFEILVTTDQNLKYQQQVIGRTIAIVVLLSTSWPKIKKCIPEIQAAISIVTPGEYQEIPI